MDARPEKSLRDCTRGDFVCRNVVPRYPSRSLRFDAWRLKMVEFGLTTHRRTGFRVRASFRIPRFVGFFWICVFSQRRFIAWLTDRRSIPSGELKFNRERIMRGLVQQIRPERSFPFFPSRRGVPPERRFQWRGRSSTTFLLRRGSTFRVITVINFDGIRILWLPRESTSGIVITRHFLKLNFNVSLLYAKMLSLSRFETQNISINDANYI